MLLNSLMNSVSPETYISSQAIQWHFLWSHLRFKSPTFPTAHKLTTFVGKHAGYL